MDDLSRSEEGNEILSTEARSSYNKYQESKDPQDLEEAIKFTSDYLDSVCSEQGETPSQLQMILADLFTARWDLDRPSNVSDLRRAISLTTSVVNASSEDLEAHTMSMYHLGNSFMHLSTQTRDVGDAWKGIAFLSIVASIKQFEWSKKSYTNLEILMQSEADLVLKALHDQTDRIEDYHLVEDELSVVVSNNVDWIRDLSDGYWRGYHRSQKLGLLERAILRMNQYLEFPQVAESSRASALCQLATMVTSHYMWSRTEENLAESIKIMKLALKAATNDEEARERCYISLGTIITPWFNSMTTSQEKSGVVEYAMLALANFPAGDIRSLWLSTVSKLLNLKYQDTQNLDDLRKAILYSREAFNFESDSEDVLWTIPTSNPKGDTDGAHHSSKTLTRDMRLADLAVRLSQLLRHLYIRTGDTTALDEATVISELAASKYPSGHSAAHYVAETLYLQYQLLSEVREDIQYVNKRVDLSRDVLQSEELPEQVSTWRRWHAESLVRRCERTKDEDELEAAVSELRELLHTTDESDAPRILEILSSLGNALIMSHDLGKPGNLLDEALELAYQASRISTDSTLVSDSQPEISEELLAEIYSRRFTKTGSEKDWDAAIRHSAQAVNILPEDHMRRANYLFQAAAYLCLNPDEQAQTKGLSTYLKCWNTPNGNLTVRSLGGFRAMGIFIARENWSEGSSIGEQVLQIQPFLADLSLEVPELEGLAGRFSGMPSTVCALALADGKSAGHAVEQLELGRGVILASLLNKRVDVSKLSQEQAALALRFKELREMLSGKGTPESTNITRLHDYVGLLMERRNVVPAFIDCVKDIRRKPGFDRFLLGPSKEDMKSIALNWYIVVINSAEFRNDAIITSSKGITSVPLVELKFKDAVKWLNKNLTEYRREEYGAKNTQYRLFLSWLWTTCVRPVLNAIELQNYSGCGQPRVWWIGTGLSSFFPFHAAGNHTPGSTEIALSHAVSSYIPTFRALSLARDKSSTSVTERTTVPSLLIVTMPQTPGFASLLGVEEEFRIIKMAVQPDFVVHRLNQPSADTVMSSLDKHDIIHFACHGISDEKHNGLDSYLVFQKPSDVSDLLPPVQDNLHVRRVFEWKFERAKIAYLSACSTAGTFEGKLADEVIHLVSAFQLAGFRHVIGALWMTKDNVCVEMAECFYEEYCQLRKTMDGDDTVAFALHNATAKIRERIPKQPLGWAPYIHFGP